jgi:type IV pilus biogenesis protein CpaD/CtpE
MHNHDAGAFKAGKFLALGLVLLWLAGCYPPSALEKNWGNSVHNNVAQQVVNPEAGLNPRPAVGLPPKAGTNEMESYNKSFSTKQTPQNIQGMQGAQSSGY